MDFVNVNIFLFCYQYMASTHLKKEYALIWIIHIFFDFWTNVWNKYQLESFQEIFELQSVVIQSIGTVGKERAVSQKVTYSIPTANIQDFVDWRYISISINAQRAWRHALVLMGVPMSNLSKLFSTEKKCHLTFFEVGPATFWTW